MGRKHSKLNQLCNVNKQSEMSKLSQDTRQKIEVKQLCVEIL